MLALSACTTIPDRRYAIESIDVEGNDAISRSELLERIASRESPKFLGLFGGVLYDHQVFNRYVLEADLQRIERYYRARGYYRARVRAGRVEYTDDRHVRIEIIVEEGAPVTIKELELQGLEAIPESLSADVESAMLDIIEVGNVLDEQQFEDGQEALRSTLANNGYAHARVERQASVDLGTHTARLRYAVHPGPPTRFGDVVIEGLGPIPDGPVRLALDIAPNSTYSEAELKEAERAVLELGVFSSVRVRGDLPRRSRGRRDKPRRNGASDAGPGPVGEQPRQPDEPLPTVVPVIVNVQRAKLRSVRLGGGLFADTLRTDVHLTAGWEHQNLFGGLQNFLVEVVPGVALYPTRVPNLQTPDRLLPQARVRTEFRQPGFLEARTNAVIRGEASAYPVLLTSDPEPDAPILGYQDFRGSVGLERQLRRLYGLLSHNVQMNRPFAYAGELDPALGAILVSYPELFAKLDLRDDAMSPREGIYLQNTLQVAGVGGDARDIKLEPEARFYIPLGGTFTFAARGELGFLFARNYGETIRPNALTGQPGGASREEWVEDVQLMFLRGLFSGGPGSNRGYRTREVAPHGVVPFYVPGLSFDEVAGECAPGSAGFSPSRCKLPLGGFTLWELSAELRFPLQGALSGVLFSDASDVAPEELKFRFNRPHLSVGVGARYATPVGPVRLDLGYRVPGLQFPEDARDEGEPDDIFGVPIAVALGIGAAF